MYNRFHACRHCGNVIGMIEDKGGPLTCCGEKMQELVPNTSDASVEKHVPSAEVKGNAVHVTIGADPHPMTDEHNISWVYLETDRGGQRKKLTLDKKAEIKFALTEEKPVAVYAYCNKHGLWKTDI